MAAGIEAASPGPWILARWHAGADRDRAHAHVTIVDVPAFVGGIGIAAAGELGHGAIKAPRAAVGNRRVARMLSRWDRRNRRKPAVPVAPRSSREATQEHGAEFNARDVSKLRFS